MLLADDGSHFALTRPEVAVLTSMMANPESRPGLAALWLHPAKAQAWATDGHQAVIAQRWRVPPKAKKNGRPVAVPALTVAHAARTAKGKDWIVIDVSGRDLGIEIRTPKDPRAEILSYEQIEVLTKPVHAISCRRHRDGPGTIEHLFPKPDARGRRGNDVALNPAYLKSIAQLAKVIDPLKVFINVGKPLDPILFTAADGTTMLWRMLIMPIRPDPLPTFGEPPTPEPATASTTSTAGGRKGRRRRSSKGATTGRELRSA